MSDLLQELKSRFPHGHQDFVELSLDEMELHEAKNADYAGDDDPLGNFNRVAALLEMHPGLKLARPVVVSLVYMLKQLDAVLHLLAEDRDGTVESIDNRLRDVHVYTKLARILLRNEPELDHVAPLWPPSVAGS